MAAVTLSLNDADASEVADVLFFLTSGLVVNFDELPSDAPNTLRYEFTGESGELEVLLNRYNGDKGIEEFGRLLRTIRE